MCTSSVITFRKTPRETAQQLEPTWRAIGKESTGTLKEPPSFLARSRSFANFLLHPNDHLSTSTCFFALPLPRPQFSVFFVIFYRTEMKSSLYDETTPSRTEISRPRSVARQLATAANAVARPRHRSEGTHTHFARRFRALVRDAASVPQ